MLLQIDLRSLLLGEEEWSFLPEVLLRSAVMFTVSLIALRLIGRRGIMQGVFELVTIITLGSAAAYIEASGRVSIFFLPDDKVVHGLPILPELFESQKEEISEKGIYSCGYCGYTEQIGPARKHTCKICEHTKWVKAIDSKRVK